MEMVFICIIILLTISFSFCNSQINNDTPTDEMGNIHLHNSNYCSGDLDFDCGEHELRTRCISSFWMCDRIYDCTTGADEINCNYLHKCPVGHFMCLDGDCIHAEDRCNDKKDCRDASDERGCHSSIQKGTLLGNGHSNADGFSDSDGKIEQQIIPAVIDRRAEAIYDEKKETSSISVFMVLFSLTLILALASLAILFTYRRYPETASRFDHALKEFNRNVISARLGRHTTLPTHVIISSPNNDQFFDNPMNTMQQPLMLNVANLGTSSVTTASNSSPDNQHFH